MKTVYQKEWKLQSKFDTRAFLGGPKIPVQGAPVPSLVRELSAHMLHSRAKNKTDTKQLIDRRHHLYQHEINVEIPGFWPKREGYSGGWNTGISTQETNIKLKVANRWAFLWEKQTRWRLWRCWKTRIWKIKIPEQFNSLNYVSG